MKVEPDASIFIISSQHDVGCYIYQYEVLLQCLWELHAEWGLFFREGMPAYELFHLVQLYPSCQLLIQVQWFGDGIWKLSPSPWHPSTILILDSSMGSVTKTGVSSLIHR
ncbi:hypothetical protein MLD38_008970 [Melastoma candidum]|uniref:Uncharacterized protein n=1 Tax=Melastoma candidum TaxID=119954 RepID=A0ACB9S4K5_9MYRT|nr:hypothetical protein MLD38_008970 [Melastoma candidum]